jgi:hypothetical protein
MARHHGSRGIRVSHLQKPQIDAIKSFYNQIVAPRVTPVRDAVLSGLPEQISAAPGAKPLVDALGQDGFKAFGGVVSVGLQAYEDGQRTDLTGPEKLGRSSLAILGVTPLGWLMAGASIIWPQQYDQITKLAFSQNDPIVQGLANLIVNVGGNRFQQWSTQSSWIDFF